MAQKRAVSIGATSFTYKLYVSELDAPNNIQSEVSLSESGVHIIWQSEVLTPYITLVSKEHGWLTQTDKDAILVMYNLFESTFTLTYDDASTDAVRFAHERGIVFTPIIEGSDKYTVQINLAKVMI